ncbi:ferrochelatase [Humibacillus sp. DSM 29435]|uniref:ferrochelatase n=1 Tax=Humibacillus sp. DSM 29435 TaxID=1869167 RepID=UPI000872CC7D|nr:ferrochelatase [Humibacillus sp. DSM 29435]OFE14490.1 ferrochelatase [Humibacillus sp. DSM 29435]
MSDTTSDATADVTANGEHELAPYDAVLLLSFGGPEAPEEVMPFLRRVTGGRGIPDERLEAVAEHYHHFGGRSPINDQNRALLVALRDELDSRGLPLPLLWGNRNSEPFLDDTLREAFDAGHRRVVTVTTSAYSCYSSCRQYRENLAEAVTALGDDAAQIVVDKIGPYAPRPGFEASNLGHLVRSMRALDGAPDREVALLFVTHSIPDAMDETSGPGDGEGRLYQRQHLALASRLTEGANLALGRELTGELVLCSRSGPPSQPWLEPDVNDRIEQLADDGVKSVVLAPIGFVSDHMEVAFDLDTEALETAQRVGVELVRVPTVGTDPLFVTDLVDALVERAAEARGIEPPQFEGRRPSVCAPGCCPNLRVDKPALCGSDGAVPQSAGSR